MRCAPNALRAARLALCFIVLTACGRAGAAPASPTAASDALPPDGIYPHGRKLAFLGYSGDPARDLARGFTVAGPVYGDQTLYLQKCQKNGWPTVAHVGPKITFNDKDPAKYKLDPPSLVQDVQRQVRELAGNRQIIWWAVHPEELRHWRSDEMQYLSLVCDTVRKNDPQHRPIFLYNPNHRDAASLAPIAQQVDIVGKGCYVNFAGRKHERGWVRWSIEQEVEALRVAGRPGAIPLLMPELMQDPEPDEDRQIRSWVRHDVYLGLASGAKGVLIFSLFKRKEVKRSWQLWYDAYSECAQELNGARGLAQVFLFGTPSATLTVRQTQGASTAKVSLGGGAEPTTTTAQERAGREIKLPAWTAAEFTFKNGRWLFLINSLPAPAVFSVTGWPAGMRAEDAFLGKAVALQGGAPLRLELPAFGVTALHWSKR